MRKDNSIVWITGASSGIGREAAKEFARIGCKVTVSSRRHSILEMINKELEKEKLTVDVLACNVASSQNVELAVKKIAEDGHIDGLINNAGITSFKAAEDNSIREIKDIINVNLLGAVYCIKAVLPFMIKKKHGTIINILSTAAEQVLMNSSAYAASKAGLLAYTNVLREEVRKYNIKIVNVLPGPTYTQMWSSEILEQYGEDMIKPEELARILVSIYLQEKKFVTEKIIIKPIRGDI